MLLNLIAAGLCLAGLATRAQAHMEMSSPPPIRSKFNANTGYNIDYDMTAPLKGDGSNFPCKGYHKLINDTSLGLPVAVLTGGEASSVTITGGAIHGGGSCQISLSVDDGQTFRVLHTYIGNCPSAPGDTQYRFLVPVDVPSKERALLAWTWFNKLGRREMYMNCASVTTQYGGEGGEFSFNRRPTIFKANIGNGCSTLDSKDVLFPNPGGFVTINDPDAAPPVGSCEQGADVPGASQPATSDATSWTTPPSPYQTSSPPLSYPAPPLSSLCPPCPPCGTSSPPGGGETWPAMI